MEAEEKHPIQDFTTPPRGQRPACEATGTADPVSRRSLEAWRRRQPSRDGLDKTHERPMSPGPMVNEESGWEGCVRSSALLKNASRAGVEGDGIVVPTVHRATEEVDTRRDDTSHGGSWQWMNSTSRRISSRKSDDEHTASVRMEVEVVEAAGTGAGEREASKPQEREFTSPVSGDDFTDSSSDNNGPVTNWFPGLSWPHYPFRSHRKKGKGKRGEGQRSDGQVQAGQSRHGVKASISARSPLSTAGKQTITRKSSPDAIAATNTGIDRPAISGDRGESFTIALPGQVAPESSHELAGGPTNDQPSSVTSMQCEIQEVDVAISAKTVQTTQPPSSSKRVPKGRGTRPSALRPENRTSEADTDRNSKCYTAVASHTNESCIEQYPGMGLIIPGPAKQDGNGGVISLDCGHSEYAYSGDSAAASTIGFDSGFDLPTNAEAENRSTTTGKGSTESMAASGGRHVHSVGAAREMVIIIGDKEQPQSRRKDNIEIRGDNKWQRKPSEKQGQTTASENRYPVASIYASAISKSGVSQARRNSSKMPMKGVAATASASATASSSPAQSTISSREQAERDRERLAGWARNSRRRSHRTSWGVTVDHTTPLGGYGTGTETGSGSWNWYHKEGSSSGWGLTTDDEGRTAASSARSKRDSSSVTPADVTTADIYITASSSPPSRREGVSIDGLSYSMPGGDSRCRKPHSVAPTPPSSHLSERFASSGSGFRSFQSSGGATGGGDGGRSSRSSSMSTGYESSVVDIPSPGEATATDGRHGGLGGKNKVKGDAHKVFSRSGECAPPSPAGDDFDIEDGNDYNIEKNSARHPSKTRSPTSEDVSMSPPPPPSPAPQPAAATPISGYYPPPSPAGSMPDVSPAKPGHGTERTALEALAQLKREHYEAMRKTSDHYRDRKARVDTMARDHRPAAGEEEPVLAHLSGAMRRQSSKSKERHLEYRRGKSFPDYIHDSTGKAPVEDDEGSRTATVTAGKGGASHRRKPYLHPSVSEDTLLAKDLKLRRQQHATAEEAARAAVAWTPLLDNQRAHKQPLRGPDFTIGMSPAGIVHGYEQRKLEQEAGRRNRRSSSQPDSESVSSKNKSRPSSLRQGEQAATKKHDSPFILPTGIKNAGDRERPPLVIPPITKVLFPQTKAPPSSQDRTGAAAASSSPFVATRETIKPRKAKKDAYRDRSRPRTKKKSNGKAICDKVLGENIAKNDGDGNSENDFEIEGKDGDKADTTVVAISPVKEKGPRDTFQGNEVYRTKSLRVMRTQLAAALVSSGQGGEQRSVSLSAIPPKGNQSQNQPSRQESSGKRRVARVCSVLSVSWLWRKNKSIRSNHRRGRRQGKDMKGTLGNVRSGAFPTEDSPANNGDSEDYRNNSLIRDDMGDAHVEAIKAPCAIEPVTATRSRSGKFKRVISFGRLGFKGGEQSEMTSFSFVHHDDRGERERAVGGDIVVRDENKERMTDKQLADASGGDDSSKKVADRTIQRLNRLNKSSSEMLAGGCRWLEANESGGGGDDDIGGVSGNRTTAGKGNTSNKEYCGGEEDLRWINFNGVDGRGGGVVAIPRRATVAAVKTDGGVSDRPAKVFEAGVPEEEDEIEAQRRMEALLVEPRLHSSKSHWKQIGGKVFFPDPADTRSGMRYPPSVGIAKACLLSVVIVLRVDGEQLEGEYFTIN